MYLNQVSTSCNLLLLLSFSCDLFLGILAPAPPPSFSTSAHSAMEATVSRLQTLITWMMENPAGLKLSSVLSQALGQFFLYHIHLWVTYIMLLLPLITPHLINLLPLLQHLPLSLQVQYPAVFSRIDNLARSRLQGTCSLFSPSTSIAFMHMPAGAAELI